MHMENGMGIGYGYGGGLGQEDRRRRKQGICNRINNKPAKQKEEREAILNIKDTYISSTQKTFNK